MAKGQIYDVREIQEKLKEAGVIDLVQALSILLKMRNHEFEVTEPGRYRISVGWNTEENGPQVGVEKTF